mgnify:CR=1 FL=1
MRKLNQPLYCILVAAALTSASLAEAAISWKELSLVNAKGVGIAEAKKHEYEFKGMLEIWHRKTESSTSLELSMTPIKQSSTSSSVTDAKFWVQGKATWNKNSNEAEESLVFEGDVAGKFASRLKCTRDPWLEPASCTVLSAQYKSTKGKIWDFPGIVNKSRLPFTQPAGNQFKPAALKYSKKNEQLDKWKEAQAKKAATPKPEPKAQPLKRLSSPAAGAIAQTPTVRANTSPSPAAPIRQIGKAVPVLTPVSPGALPDITADAGMTIGSKPASWGGIVAVSAAEARIVRNGMCEFAVRHVTRNTSAAAAGAFHRRWTNSNVPGNWNDSNPPIPAGGTVERVDTLPLKPGRNVLYLTLDSTGAVAENNENNNLTRIAVDLSGECGTVAPATPGTTGGRLKIPKP